ncbi:putative quinol monooxygenase [Zeaxanthinibacter sp. PT1]|uniref:putative quinol monooxygenase n=1 Tax=Zeaxanthinibacter TaxID=561554 RepID=UPI00234B4554|nr:putative quinol monooxygenase [Zeaxanthinibacter sp. PT1]MDC6350940.1 putative quinol monooxygenase [Zeaxanthinibacter sp. PT1]
MKQIIFSLSFIILTFLSACNNLEERKNHLMVTVTYKTQPNKNVDALVALEELLDKVKKEEHFVSVTLLVDPEDNSNIMLYEEWADAAYYKNQHMQTEHLKQFREKANEFLVGPPQISYWKINQLIE